MTRISITTLCVAGGLAFNVGWVAAQTAQESVERTIGSLVLQNANCTAQGMAAQEELRKVKAELDALKAKQPGEPAK